MCNYVIMYDWVDLFGQHPINSEFSNSKILWEEWTFFIWNYLNPITTIAQVQVGICLQSANINLYLCLQMVVYRYEIQCFHKYFAKSFLSYFLFWSRTRHKLQQGAAHPCWQLNRFIWKLKESSWWFVKIDSHWGSMSMQCPSNIIVSNCIKYKKVVNSRMPLLRNLVLVDRFVYPNLFLLILVILCKNSNPESN